MVSKLVIQWSPAVLCAVAIVVASFRSFDFQMPTAQLYTATFAWGPDKLWHAMGFVSLALVLRWASTLSQTCSIGCAIVQALVFGACLGGLIEVFQPFVGGTCDLMISSRTLWVSSSVAYCFRSALHLSFTPTI